MRNIVIFSAASIAFVASLLMSPVAHARDPAEPFYDKRCRDTYFACRAKCVAIYKNEENPCSARCWTTLQTCYANYRALDQQARKRKVLDTSKYTVPKPHVGPYPETNPGAMERLQGVSPSGPVSSSRDQAISPSGPATIAAPSAPAAPAASPLYNRTR